MTEWLPPGFVLILGALFVPFLRGHTRKVWLLLLPVLGLLQIWGLPNGYEWNLTLFGFDLQLVRVDALSRIFGTVFYLAAFLGLIFALHVEDDLEVVSALMYAGAAIAAVFVGDLISLFVFWELTAVTSLFLIWARRTERAYRAGLRYLIVQVTSGVLLLAGTLIHYADTGSLAFGSLGLVSLGTGLIFVGFGIKAAFPLLHAWLEDAYPEATVTGTVFLSAFTTKLAIYALARSFAGTEILVPIGALMTVFPIFYAVIENDLRRVLAYSLNNQLGFMVVGIGIGTEMALNGTVAHAFAHILYKALLFMSMGAVLFRAGTIKGSELGGLYKSMPWTAAFCIVGAASISAFPLFSGFISKSLILAATADNHYTLTFLVLLFASAGVFHHAGIKVPYFAFFAHDSGIRCEEAPLNMRIAMGIAAALCIGLGLWPGLLYSLLPFPVNFDPYTTTHVVTQLQLLFFAAAAFVFLQKTGIYPPELASINLDVDWLYRRAGPRLVAAIGATWARTREALAHSAGRHFEAAAAQLRALHAPPGVLGEPWSTSQATLWVALALVACLAVAYW